MPCIWSRSWPTSWRTPGAQSRPCPEREDSDLRPSAVRAASGSTEEPVLPLRIMILVSNRSSDWAIALVPTVWVLVCRGPRFVEAMEGDCDARGRRPDGLDHGLRPLPGGCRDQEGGRHPSTCCAVDAVAGPAMRTVLVVDDEAQSRGTARPACGPGATRWTSPPTERRASRPPPGASRPGIVPPRPSRHRWIEVIEGLRRGVMPIIVLSARTRSPTRSGPRCGCRRLRD